MEKFGIEDLLHDLNEEFVRVATGTNEPVVLDLELSGRSPTCKCMRGASDQENPDIWGR